MRRVCPPGAGAQITLRTCQRPPLFDLRSLISGTLELIRYIHLNPLRAKVVKDLKELDKYPWTGHSAILDRCKNHLIPNAKSRKNPRNPAPVNSRNLRLPR
jgi:hypothetical protein